MYAIIDTNGKQVRVSTGDTIEVEHIDAEEGTEITFDRVLLLATDTEDGVQVGAPLVPGASVKARVLAHGKGEKVVTLKYRRRKRSRVKRGFRATTTLLQILDIAV
ncbi:MAG: 50S ribosomal protein L21 [Pseudomonadota bacterium]